MINLLIFHPGTVAILALAGLAALSLVIFSPRRRAVCLAVAILAPIYPVLIVRALALETVLLIDRATNRGPLIWAAETLRRGT